MRGALSALICAAGLLGPQPAGADAATGPAIQAAEWRAYRDAFVQPSGRVVDDANGEISHSEGQGYGMLLAVLADQQADFEAMWSFTRAEMMVRDDGLVAWKWDPTAAPHISDINNASDGDILIAYALDLAAEAWGRDDFRDAARGLTAALGATVLADQHGAPVLLPGATGFATDDRPDGPVVNLSYWVFEAMPTLARLDPATPWSAVGAEGLRLLDRAQVGPRKLPPEWLSLHAPPRPAAGFPAEFGYNALRIPLYLLRAGVGDDALLTRLAAGLDTGGDLAIVDLDTGRVETALSDPGYRAIVGLLACRLTGAPLADDLQSFQPTNYYPSTLHLLVLAHARKVMPQCV